MDPVAAHGGGGRHHFGPPVGSPFHSPFHGGHGHGCEGQFQQPQFQTYVDLHGHQAQMLANSMGGGGGGRNNGNNNMLAKQELVDRARPSWLSGRAEPAKMTCQVFGPSRAGSASTRIHDISYGRRAQKSDDEAPLAAHRSKIRCASPPLHHPLTAKIQPLLPTRPQKSPVRGDDGELWGETRGEMTRG